MCRVGRNHDLSSSVPARTRITPSLGGPVTQVEHSGQTHRVFVRPLSAVRWSGRGEMPLMLNPASDTTIPSEKALPVNRWHSVQ
jgi:hypothetical protein